jgi:hypothetical protein
MPKPSTPEARNLRREVQALIDQAVVQQSESSASCMCYRSNTRGSGGAQDQEASVHALQGGATGQLANQGRTPVRDQILDRRDQAQVGTLAMS